MTLVAAAGGGDDFANTSGCFLVVYNGDASPITVTFDSTKVSDLGTDVNVVESVAATTYQIFGPFHAGRYGASLGITYSAVTSVTVGAFRLPKPQLTT